MVYSPQSRRDRRAENSPALPAEIHPVAETDWAPEDTMNSIPPAGWFFHFLASKQKVKRKIDSAPSASQAKRAVRIIYPVDPVNPVNSFFKIESVPFIF
jgi:hypothetical protein